MKDIKTKLNKKLNKAYIKAIKRQIKDLSHVHCLSLLDDDYVRLFNKIKEIE